MFFFIFFHSLHLRLIKTDQATPIKIQEDRFRNNEMSVEAINLLLETLNELHSEVTKLELSNNEMTDECMTKLGNFLQDNRYLEVLNIGGTRVTHKGVEILSEYLFGNTTLKVLDLSDVVLPDASIPLLIEIAKKTCITSMFADDSEFSVEKEEELAECLAIPIDQREIPIKSGSKSAAKSSLPA